MKFFKMLLRALSVSLIFSISLPVSNSVYAANSSIAKGPADAKNTKDAKDNTDTKDNKGIKEETVKLKMELEVDGAVVSHPHTTLAFGEKGMITQRVSDNASYVIEVTPTKGASGEIKMEMKIDKTVDGITSVVSSPKVSTLIGQAATVEQNTDNGTHSFKLSITPSL